MFVDLLAGELHDRDGRLLSLDVPLGAVAPVAGRPGAWIAAAGTGFAIVEADRAPQWLARPLDGAPVPMRMNDGACDPSGRFWAGSMAADGTGRHGGVYRIDAAGTVEQVLDGLGVPNGPVFSSDGATMYVADSATAMITRFAIDPDGRPVNSEPFAVLDGGRPDGMTVDDRERLWVAVWDAGQVRCYRPDGGLDHALATPTPRPTSVCLADGMLVVTTARRGLACPDPLAGVVLSMPSGSAAPTAAAYNA